MIDNESLLSIIIPVYNIGGEIYKTLNSLMHIDNDKLQIVIINDGSSDNSKEIIEKYILRNPNYNFTFITTVNKGVSHARNCGIKHSKGKYIYFLDGGDEVLPQFNEFIIKKIDNFKEDMIVFGYNRLNDKGEIINKYFDNNILPNKLTTSEETLDLILNKKNFHIWTGSAIYKSVFLKDNHLKFTVNCTSGEDTEFIFKSIIKAESVGYIQHELSSYFIVEGSVTNRFNIRLFDTIYAHKRIYEYALETKKESIIKVLKENINKMILLRYMSYYSKNLYYMSKEKKPKKLILNNLNVKIDKSYPQLREYIKKMFSVDNTKEIKFRIHKFLFLNFPFVHSKLINNK